MPVAISGRLLQSEPVLGYTFVVLLGKDPLGFFTECSGLTIERDIKSHPEGGVNTYEHQLPGRLKYTSVTLKRGLAGSKLWDWFQEGLYTGKIERRNVTIMLLTPDLIQLKAWDLTDVYPSKWTGPTFNTGKSEVSVESIELTRGTNLDALPPDPLQRMSDNEGTNLQNTEAAGTGQNIDMSALANKVYDLLKQELRLERERLGWRR